MKKLAILTAAAAMFCTAGSANATVIWTFIVTSCSTPFVPACPTAFGSSAIQPGTSLATIVIDQPTAAGTASWDASEYVVPPIPPAIVTGDPNFALSFHNGINISPPNYNQLLGCFGGPCFYNLTWSETPASLSLDIIAQADDTAALGLAGDFGTTGGMYYDIGVCSQWCDIRGFWQSNLVPEPMSASLLVSALLGLAVARRSRSGLSATNDGHKDASLAFRPAQQQTWPSRRLFSYSAARARDGQERQSPKKDRAAKT